MDDRLLIKATPELLEGWCGPVRVPDPAWRSAAVWGPSEDPDCPGCWLTWAPFLGLQQWIADQIRLDLSRAECRDRVVRVLAWECRYVPEGAWWWNIGDGRWSLRAPLGGGKGYVTFRSPGSPEPSEARPEVSALADLDPTDNTRLPDGSRLVDALALAAVWREVTRG